MKKYREMLDYMHDVERTQANWCLEVHSAVKNLIGTEKMIVFDVPISTYGKYGKFTRMAMCGGKILMCDSELGWVDKPIQPYHGTFWHFMNIERAIEKGNYHLEDNPIKESTYDIVC